MKACVFDRYGPSEVLRIEDVPVPVPGPGQVLIEVHATSVNPLDWKIRKGSLRFMSGFAGPKLRVLGYDVAGIVSKVAPDVLTLNEGDRVYAFTGPGAGANAEFVCLSADIVCTMPKSLSFSEAAAIPLAGLTALQAIKEKGRLREGMDVLVNGASGGVGSFAVQIARALGASVTGTCGPDNLDAIKTLGADRVINYREEDFKAGSAKFDIIFDSVSKRPFKECRSALKPGGVYVTTIPRPGDLPYLLLPFIRGGLKAYFVKVRPDRTGLDLIKEMIDADKMKPLLDRTFSLEQLPEAHDHVELGHSRGKNIVKIR